MNVAIYIQMNVVSSLLCILLYYQQKKHNAFSFLGTTAFNSILWMAVLLMSIDSLYRLMSVGLLPGSQELLMLIQSIYYFLQALLPLLFMEYGIAGSKVASNIVFRIIRYAPLAFTAVVLGYNFTTHFAFEIVNNIFRRADGFLYTILAPMLYVAFSLFACTVFLFRASPERKKISLHMFICVLLTFLGAAFSALIPGISPWHVFVFALVYLYMQLHSVQERSLDLLAFTDSLTGLKNYTAYSHLKQLTNQKLVANPNFRFAIAFMDINDLKKTNDTYGHAAGNELIRRSARLLCDVFQHSPVCRTGGDEFIAILENGDYEKRDALLEEFNRLMLQTTFAAGEHQLPVSASLGISAYDPELHHSFDNVLHDAEKAMYARKAFIKQNR